MSIDSTSTLSMQREVVYLVRVGSPDWKDKVERAFTERRDIRILFDNGDGRLNMMKLRARSVLRDGFLPASPAQPAIIPNWGVNRNAMQRLCYVLASWGEPHGSPPDFPPGAYDLYHLVRLRLGMGSFHIPQIKLRACSLNSFSVYFIFFSSALGPQIHRMQR
jgi:hypothetical protein